MPDVHRALSCLLNPGRKSLPDGRRHGRWQSRFQYIQFVFDMTHLASGMNAEQRIVLARQMALFVELIIAFLLRFQGCVLLEKRLVDDFIHSLGLNRDTK